MAQEGEEGREGATEGVAADELLPPRVVDHLADLELWGEMERRNAGGQPFPHLD